MVAMAYTVAFGGIDARLLQVQCAISPGLLGFSIVGLPDKAVSEARERLRAALTCMAIALPVSASAPICPPPTCRKRALLSTCPLRWPRSPRWTSCRMKRSLTLSRWVNCPSEWYAGPGCWRTARRCCRGRGRLVPDVPCLVRGRGCLGRQRSRHRACDTGVGDRASDRPRGS